MSFQRSSTAALVVAVLAACGDSRVEPASQVIWKNGVSGSWFGETPSVELVRYGTRFAAVAASDPISGDSSGLQVGSNVGKSLGGGISLETASPHDASTYAGGHLQFNLRLDFSGVSGVTVGYGLRAGSTYTTTLDLVPLPVGSFAHVSVPISILGGSLLAVDMPFQLTVEAVAGYELDPGPLVTVSDLRWTTD